MNEIFIWSGIFLCLSQSAMFSGLNLAFFSYTRLRLEIEADAEPEAGAHKVLKMRDDSNFLLTTILWGNVGINVLLTLLSDSVMAGIISFSFSTFLITFFGEIIPQAYFSRNALKMATMLSPVLKFYQIVLFPVAKPSALLLDAWLGKESIQFLAEKNIISFIKKHIEGSGNEIDHIEGTGAINFLTLDDLLIEQEGENINELSIINIPSIKGELVFPDFKPEINDEFIQQINRSEEKWIIFVDENGKPIKVLDADGFIRSALFCKNCEGIEKFCHNPIIVEDKTMNLGETVKFFSSSAGKESDLPVEKDIVLVWTDSTKKIITGADILGRLLVGI